MEESVFVGEKEYEKEYIVDKGDSPLGAGATAIVYLGKERGTNETVAVKIARQGSDSVALESFFREADIIAKLRDETAPGGKAVPWAAQGKGCRPACIVMEMVPEDAQLSRAFASRRDETEPGTNILVKEILATASGVGYAELLQRMAARNIISRGDRKATDFRWIPNAGDPANGRLVVLDWNRAVEIDPDAGNWDPAYRERLRDELKHGRHDDIRLFGKWWGEFLLNREVRDALPALDAEEPNWQALSLNLRTILRRSFDAGRWNGYDTVDELLADLQQHLRLLSGSPTSLTAAMDQLRHDAQPAPESAAKMATLLDLASKKGLRDSDLRDYQNWLSGKSGEADRIAAGAYRDLGSFKNMDYEKATADVTRALDDLKQHKDESKDSNTAWLRLVRWQTAISATDVSGAEYSSDRLWASRVSELLRLMHALGNEQNEIEARALSQANELWQDVVVAVPGRADGLEPLGLELGVRRALLQEDAHDEAGEKWLNLQVLNEDYAHALRGSSSQLNAVLARQADTAIASGARGDLGRLHLALFDIFIKDCRRSGAEIVKTLRERTRPAKAQDQGDYLANRNEFYRRFYSLVADEEERAHAFYDNVLWLDALVNDTARGKLADAIDRLLAPQGIPEEDLSFVDEAYRRAVVQQAKELINRQAPRWPDELRNSQAALEALIGRQKTTTLAAPVENQSAAGSTTSWSELAASSQPPLAARSAEFDGELLALRKKIEEQIEHVDRLRQELGYEQFKDNWAAFVQHVTQEPGSGDAYQDTIDVALRDAIGDRLEVWERPVLTESLSEEDQEKALEGFRARTLLALRAHHLLPQRLGQLSEDLQKHANELGTNQPKESLLTSASGYLADMAPLLLALDSLEKENRRSSEASASAHKLAKELGTRVEELQDRQRQATSQMKTALADHNNAQRMIGLRYLNWAIDQAVRLELEASEEHLGWARLYLAASPENTEDAAMLDRLEQSIKEMQQLRQERGAWESLHAWRQALDTHNIHDAERALAELTKAKPSLNRSNNLILAELRAEYIALRRSGLERGGTHRASTDSFGAQESDFPAVLAQWTAIAKRLKTNQPPGPTDPEWEILFNMTDKFLGREVELEWEQAHDLKKLLSEVQINLDQSTYKAQKIPLNQLKARLESKQS